MEQQTNTYKQRENIKKARFSPLRQTKRKKVKPTGLQKVFRFFVTKTVNKQKLGFKFIFSNGTNAK